MNTSPVVKTMRLPQQVVRAKARADELLNRTPDDPALAVTPGLLPENPAAPAPAPVEPVDFATAEPITPEGKYWRQRFKVTDGLFRAARDKHAADLERRDSEAAELRGDVARLKSAQSVESAPQEISQFLTPQQIDELGEDQARAVVSTAIKAAREQAQALVSAELAPIKAREEAAQQRESRQRTDAFTDALDAGVPEWRDIDEDPRWLAFLGGVDRATEMNRQEIIDLAKRSMNAKPIIRLLKSFKQSQGAIDTPEVTVAPSGSAASGAGATGQAAIVVEGGVPTKAEIKEHFKLRAIGKIKEDEARKFDARLKAAEAVNLLR
jgi:hypothetical protein